MKNRTLFAMAIATVSVCAHAAHPGPISKSLPPSAQLTVPPVDVRTLADEDSKARGEAMRYGMPQRVDRPLISAGEATLGSWQTQADGRLRWSTTITSADAVSLDLHFSRFALPAGAEMYLANAAGDYVLGPIRGSDALASGQYYTALVPGDAMRVDVIVPVPERAQVDLQLASVTYGYRGLFGRDDHPEAIRSGACNIDVECPLGDTWGDQIDAVGQYIFQDGGSYVCTGSLIGNTSGTPVPYFITANHCVSTNTVANSMRVYWNYQSPTCRTPGSGASGTPLPRPATFNNGATLRATYGANDTSLVQLNADVPADQNPFFLGWDRRDLATPSGPGVTGAVTIHHPSGHEKRITRDADSLSVTTYLSNTATPTGSHYRIGNWEEGTTEGGSSGSALFSPDGYLIGTLHGGYASCNSITQDWYGRIYQSWNGGGTDASRLSTWLDPEGDAPETFAGYRGEPLGDADVSIDLAATPNPVDIGETVTLTATVANDGPEAATQVEASFTLPTGLAFNAGTGTGWTCSAAGANVTCDLAGSLASGASAADLDVVADVTATEVGTVNVTATVSALENDAVPGNNQADVDIGITGTPPLPDCIFADGFEVGGDGSCAAPADPDIVDSGILDIVIPGSVGINGFSINWVTGATCNCDTDPGFDFNPYAQDGGLLSFWLYPNDPEGTRAGMVVGGKYAALASGATVGPGATFESVGGPDMPTYMVDWRAGTTGYLGFRFHNPDTNTVNYGYVELASTAGGGFPLTLVRYWYNSAGNPITIP